MICDQDRAKLATLKNVQGIKRTDFIQNIFVPDQNIYIDYHNIYYTQLLGLKMHDTTQKCGILGIILNCI